VSTAACWLAALLGAAAYGLLGVELWAKRRRKLAEEQSDFDLGHAAGRAEAREVILARVRGGRPVPQPRPEAPSAAWLRGHRAGRQDVMDEARRRTEESVARRLP